MIARFQQFCHYCSYYCSYSYYGDELVIIRVYAQTEGDGALKVYEDGVVMV